jgi:hypothetical protein
MTARTREDELREVPLWKANKEAWPAGVREIGQDELNCLGIDLRGNLYWDGKPIEVRHFLLTRWQKVGAVIVAVSALIGGIGAAAPVCQVRTKSGHSANARAYGINVACRPRSVRRSTRRSGPTTTRSSRTPAWRGVRAGPASDGPPRALRPARRDRTRPSSRTWCTRLGRSRASRPRADSDVFPLRGSLQLTR